MSSKSKTVLHIIDTTGPGGAETVFTQLAQAAISEGYKSIALIRGPGWVRSELERLGITIYECDCKGSFNFKFLLFIIKLIRKEKVNVIQSHLLGSNVYASMAGLISRTPVISTFHGFVDVPDTERFSLLKFIILRIGSDRIVAVTDQLKEKLLENNFLNHKKIMVIANGVDTDIFLPKSKYTILTDQLVRIGCLGNVRKPKNYPLAMETLKLLLEKGVNAQLHIAGDDTNDLAKSCKKMAEELGIAQSICWHGFITDAPEYLKNIDVFMLSSSSEGHPLALTQAMAVGLPIVTTSCGVEHIIENHVSGLMVENQSAVKLADAIALLTKDEPLRVALGKTARCEVEQKWGLSATLKKYFELYELV